MKRTLLHLVTSLKRYLKLSSTTSPQTDLLLSAIDEQEKKAKPGDASPEEQDLDVLLDELAELRDIVEQVDFAGAFCKMNGMPFLLGAAASGSEVPLSLRSACLGLIATVAQNNPEAQDAARSVGAASKLSGMWGGEEPFMAKILQALSACVRGHKGLLEDFYACEQAVKVVKAGFELGGPVRSRAALFLRSLLTDDESTPKRAGVFSDLLASVVSAAADREISAETCRGILLGMLSKGGDHALLVHPYASEIQSHFRFAAESYAGGEGTDEDREDTERVASEWKGIMVLLKKEVKKELETTSKVTTSSVELVVTNEWQMIPEGKSVPKGCELRMNFETGENFVRLLQKDDGEEGGEVKNEKAIMLT